MNPWLSVGGVATSICRPDEYILPDSALVGDVLVLTKPLGTQVRQQGISGSYGDVEIVHGYP